MRKTALLLFLFLIPLVFAKTETTKVLHFNDTATVYGKTLTLSQASTDGKIKINVDGVEGMARGINRTANINEMWINILNFTYVDSESFDVIFELTVNFECGDEACNSSENSVSCCTDCGCEGNLKCINNICMEEGCVIDWDCDDKNNCTVDKCSGAPKACSNTLIAQCVGNDSCCPSICGPANDTDCKAEEFVEEEAEPEKVEKSVTEKVEVSESEEKVLVTEKEKGILIMAGAALLVIIVGFIIFGRK